MAEKAQQEPQSPWSLTGVTAPRMVQSMSPTEMKVSLMVGGERGMGKEVRYFCWN